MKIIKQVNSSYTLYENELNEWILEVEIPSKNNAWAIYTEKIKLSTLQKVLIKLFPSYLEKIVSNYSK